MKRRLFTTLAALSLLLCVAVCALWVFWRHPVAFACSPQAGAQSWLYLGVYDGRAYLGAEEFKSGGRTYQPAKPGFRSIDEYRQRSGLTVIPEHRQTALVGRPIFRYEARLWPLIVCTALAPAAWLLVRLRRVKIKEGHCLVCGYDLRASSERCPECGAPAPQKPTMPQ